MNIHSSVGISRRGVLAAAGASAAFGAWAQGLPGGASDVYATLSEPVAEDRSKVVEFFAYTCPYCQRMHSALGAWARTLPKKVAFESIAVPLLGSQIEYEVLLFRAGIVASSPSLLAAFDQAVLDRLSVSGAMLDYKLIGAAFAEVGLSVEAVRRGTASRGRALVEGWLSRAGRYRINATPSIGVGGRYVVTPDSVGGRFDLFPSLLNGLVSRIV